MNGPVIDDDVEALALAIQKKDRPLYPWLLACGLSVAIDVGAVAVLLVNSIGTDAYGNRTVPLALLMLPASVTCIGYLLIAQWWRHGHRQGAKVGLGVLWLCVSAMSFGLSQQYAVGGIETLVGGGFGGLWGTAFVDMVAALLFGLLFMTPGLLVIWSELKSAYALKLRAAKHEVAGIKTIVDAGHEVQATAARLESLNAYLSVHQNNIAQTEAKRFLALRAQQAAERRQSMQDRSKSRLFSKDQRRDAARKAEGNDHEN